MRALWVAGLLLLAGGCSNGNNGDFVVGGVPASPAASEPPPVLARHERPADSPFRSPAETPLSTFSIDVDTASYADVRRSLEAGVQPPADALRLEEILNYFPYKYPVPARNQPFSLNTELSNCPWNSQHYVLRVGIQGRTIPADQLPPRNLVFLLDVSGSMSGNLELVKNSLRKLVATLSDADRVAIVTYAGAAGVALEPTADKNAILAALDRLESGGSTNGGEGIQAAYALAQENFNAQGVNRVILATDGDFNVGVSNTGELLALIEEKRKTGVYLTALGFGQNNDAMMEQLADKGNGNYAVIDSEAEAEKVLVREGAANLVTIAEDVKIQVEFNPKNVSSYRLLGYENRALAAADFNDDKKDAGEVGAGHRVTALYELDLLEKGKRPAVDPLRYGKTGASTDELCQLKVRYKAPGGKSSRLLSTVVTRDQQVPLAKSSDDFRWAAAVAEFGMALRYRPEASLAHARELASEARGQDPEGYRSQFLTLVERAESLQAPPPGSAR